MASLVFKYKSYYAVFSVNRKKKWIRIGKVRYYLLWGLMLPSHLSCLLYIGFFCLKNNLTYGPIIGGQVS
jgi:hypothetical protein